MRKITKLGEGAGDGEHVCLGETAVLVTLVTNASGGADGNG